MEVKSRHHLRSDDIAAIREAVADHLGVDIDGETFEFVEFVDAGYELVLVDGDPPSSTLTTTNRSSPFAARTTSSRRPGLSPLTPARYRSSPTAQT